MPILFDVEIEDLMHSIHRYSSSHLFKSPQIQFKFSSLCFNYKSIISAEGEIRTPVVQSTTGFQGFFHSRSYSQGRRRKPGLATSAYILRYKPAISLIMMDNYQLFVFY